MTKLWLNVQKIVEKYGLYCGKVKKLVTFSWITFFFKVPLTPIELKFVVNDDLCKFYLKYKNETVLHFYPFLYGGLSLSLTVTKVSGTC